MSHELENQRTGIWLEDANTMSTPGLRDRLGELRVAFQPIVDIHTGQCFGYEVLVRNHEVLGATAVPGLLDACHGEGCLEDLELTVRRKAAALIERVPAEQGIRLFFNLDTRIAPQSKAIIAEVSRVAPSRPGREVRLITEIASHPAGELGTSWLHTLRSEGCGIAIDGFRADGGGFLLLCDADPDFVKIDRLYIRRIDHDTRRRLLLSQIVATAHLLGIAVVAVGVESEKEFLVCREVGCDLVQGYLVQPPVEDPSLLQPQYDHIATLVRGDRRRRPGDQKWIVEQLESIAPVLIDAPMSEVFARFASAPERTFLPVVDHAGQPLGMVRETNLKQYAYSTFGRDLMCNRAIGRSLRDFLTRCPVADIATPLNQIMAIYSADDRGDGIIVTEHLRYFGFLSARSIVRAMHERTVAAARDENPLTKLPGNAVINDYVSSSLADGRNAVFAYIDFDNFKPFNDTYGFRLGDRAILLFAELMRKSAKPDTWFLGHIGGDDFFVGLQDLDMDTAADVVRHLIARFAADAESFYDAETRTRGHIIAKNREGIEQRFPLLSASAVLLAVAPGNGSSTADDVSAAIATKKKAAKSAPDKIAIADLRSQPEGTGTAAG